MQSSAEWRRAAAAAAAVAALVVLSAQTPAASGKGANDGLLDTAIYLIKVGRLDEAADMMRQIMATKPTPAEALRLRNRAGYDLLAPLLAHEKLGPPVRELLRLAAEAIAANRTDPTYINEMIDLLGTAREPRAIRQLRISGPYAIPHVVAAYRDPAREVLRPRLQALLTRLPAEAAPAMIEALHCPDVNVKAALADALGQMNSRLALAELKRMAEDPRVGEVVQAPVEGAVRSILGRRAWSAKPAVEYALDLVMAYHTRAPWTIPPGTAATLPVWTWDGKADTLTSVEVPRTQYGPWMAERTARRMAAHWPKYEAVYPAWYLAKLGRLWEATARPAGGWDPAAIRRDVRLLGSVLGDRRLTAGLAWAIERRDWRGALGFLEGLELVARSRTVRVEPAIAEALSVPDRRVQFESALVCAAAGPRRAFEGSDLVVPLLGEAVIQAMRRELVIVTPDIQSINRWRVTLREAGFTIHDVRSSREGWEQLVASPAVELVMLHPGLAGPTTEVFLRQVRTDPRTRRLPVVLMARNVEEARRLEKGLAQRHPHVGVLRADPLPEQVLEAVQSAITEARGVPIAPAEAAALASRAVEALLDIGPDHPVFPLIAAGPQLESALVHGGEGLRVSACRVLAELGEARHQRALARAALAEDASAAVIRAALTALVTAIRRKGNGIQRKDAAALVSLTDRGDPAITALTARLIGVTGLGAEDPAGTYRRTGGQ